jgi:hypothetical protein
MLPLPMAMIPYPADLVRAMIFVDGENLAIRYGSMVKGGQTRAPLPGFLYVENVCVWAPGLAAFMLHCDPAMRI